MAGRFSVEAVFKAIDRFTRPVSRMQRRMERFTRATSRGMRSVSPLISGVGGNVQRLATSFAKLGVAAAAGIGAAMYVVGKAGADFEEAMSAVSAVMMKPIADISELSDQAKQLGATTKFTATEAAQGMEILAKAGFNVKEVGAAIPGVLHAAAASGLELAEVSDHVSNVLKGMGRSAYDAAKAARDLGYSGAEAWEMTRRLTMDASQAGRVADVLALASSRTNSTIGSLGESMRNVAATARQLNVPLEDVIAAVASLQDVGLDASVAGSALNTMLTKMAKPTDEIAAKMKKFGVSFKDTKGNMLPLQKVLENLARASDKAGGSFDRVAFFADLVGLRGQKAASNLADLFKEGKVADLAESLRNAAGSAEKMSKMRLDNLKGDLTLLGSQFDALKTQIYETQSGPLRGLTKRMRDWLDLNSGSISAGVTLWSIRLKPAMETFGKAFEKTMGSMRDAFKGFNGWTAAQRILPELAKNLGQLAAVSVMVLGALGALAVGFIVTMSVLWSTVRGAVDGMLQAFGGLVYGVMDWWANLKAIFDAEGMGLAKKIFKIGVHIVSGLANGIRSAISLPIDAIVNVGKGILRGIAKALGIASDSKKAKVLGAFTASGFASGIKTGTAAVQKALDDMTAMQPKTISIAPRVKAPAMQDVMIRQRFMTLGSAAKWSGPSAPPPDERPEDAPHAYRQPHVATPRGREDSARDELVDAILKLTDAMRGARSGEVTIRDQSGRAEVTKAPSGGRARLSVKRSGAF